MLAKRHFDLRAVAAPRLDNSMKLHLTTSEPQESGHCRKWVPPPAAPWSPPGTLRLYPPPPGWRTASPPEATSTRRGTRANLTGTTGQLTLPPEPLSNHWGSFSLCAYHRLPDESLKAGERERQCSTWPSWHRWPPLYRTGITPPLEL